MPLVMEGTPCTVSNEKTTPTVLNTTKWVWERCVCTVCTYIHVGILEQHYA